MANENIVDGVVESEVYDNSPKFSEAAFENGIPSEIFQIIHKGMLPLPAFESDQALEILMKDDPILVHYWYGMPESHNVSRRVDGALDHLHKRKVSLRGENNRVVPLIMEFFRALKIKYGENPYLLSKPEVAVFFEMIPNKRDGVTVSKVEEKLKLLPGL